MGKTVLKCNNIEQIDITLTSNFSSGTLGVFKYGRIVIVEYRELAVTTSGNNLVLATGLPKPLYTYAGYVKSFPTGQAPATTNMYSMYVDDGALKYNMGSSKPTMFGTIVYFV